MHSAAAPWRDAHLPWSKQAAMSEACSTDATLSVTTVVAQILRAVGCTEQFPVGRYLRQVKAL